MKVVLGDLPTWNLADLSFQPERKDLNADLERAAVDAEAFARDYEGKIAGAPRQGAGRGGRAL